MVLRLLIFVLLILSFSSCEEVVNIDLNSSNPIIVAEGRICKDSVAHLRLSYTSNYFDEDPVVVIDDAVVKIVDDFGHWEVLENVGNGNYQGEFIVGREGYGYTISFEVNDKVYSAYSRIENPIQSIHIEVEEMKMKFPMGQEVLVSHFVKVKFQVPEEESYYLIDFWNNGEKLNDRYFLVNNLLGIIGEVEATFHSFDLEDGVLKVEVFSLDKESYIFHSQMNELGGRMMGSTPYNPSSNFGGEVLGYFTALSYSWKECAFNADELNESEFEDNF